MRHNGGMAGDSSFDIVSKVDHQEVDNALNMAAKEVRNRFDFKGTDASIRWSGEAIEMEANGEERVKAITLKFYEDNADLQGIPEFVNAAYEAEARHYAALGVNIQDALLRDPEAVSRRVADAARSRAVELGLRLGSSETEEDGGSEARPAGFGSRGRTAGVSGRSASKAARNGKAPDGPGDFAAELRREQASSGFF